MGRGHAKSCQKSVSYSGGKGSEILLHYSVMKHEDLLAAGLVLLLSTTSVLEGTHEKWYRMPHTHSEVPISELPSDNAYAANSTVTWQTYGSLFDFLPPVNRPR